MLDTFNTNHLVPPAPALGIASFVSNAATLKAVRFFRILAWAGRLHRPPVAAAGLWKPEQLHYEPEVVVDKLLTLMTTDAKVTTVEAIAAEIERSRHHAGSRSLWIPDYLASQVAQGNVVLLLGSGASNDNSSWNSPAWRIDRTSTL